MPDRTNASPVASTFRSPSRSDHNRRIVDLANAINLKNGEVEFSADFVAIQPKDPSKGNGSMILESPNRGHSAILRIVDGGDWNAEHDAGDAWLLRKGFSFVSLGWQWDAATASNFTRRSPRKMGRRSPDCCAAI